jgi:hypothetical protein
MKPQEWLRIIRRKEFVFIFFDAILLVLPGAGALFVYDNQAFMSLDWARIVLLGAALMAPLDFLNMVILPDVFGEFGEKAKDDVFVIMTASILSTSLLVYAAVAISYVAGYSARFCTGALIGIEVLFVLIAFVRNVRNKKRMTPEAKAEAEAK